MNLLQPPRIAAALAALALASHVALAQDSSPAATRTPGIAGVVAADTPIEFIRDGFKGTEGPVALPDGSLLFTETQDRRITRIAADGSVSPFLDDSNGANGLGFNASGDLVAVQVFKPQVGIVYPAAHARVLADQFEGAPFGRPNDVVVDRQGNIYFTDSGVAPAAAGAPAPGSSGPAPARPAVYRIGTAGKLERLAADIERPNGIQLSPDERVLYVANTAGEHVLAFDIRADGSVGPWRNFARLEGWRKLENGSTSSGADGLAVDAQGRLYVASSVGVQIFSGTGQALGIIALPKAPQNLAFAGPDKRSLYVVGRGSAWRIATLTQGYGGRAK
jgi:gluconolactonase